MPGMLTIKITFFVWLLTKSVVLKAILKIPKKKAARPEECQNRP